jgi:outer membrane immunogenic protein
MKYLLGPALLGVYFTGHAQTQLATFPVDSTTQASTFRQATPATTAAPGSSFRTTLGLKIGGALTTKAGDVSTAPTTKLLPGGVLGVYQLLPLSQRRGPQYVQFYFQPEVLFSLQGFRLVNAPTQYEAKARSYYVCVPLLLTASWKGLLLQVGLQGGYMLGVRERYEFVDWATGVAGVNYNKSARYYQRKELAYVVGVGYRLPQGLGLEARYVAGLTNLYDLTSNSIYSSYTNQHNAGVQVQLSYPLVKKK